jgi:hypothetical protein
MSTVITPSYALQLGNLRSLVVPNFTGEQLPVPIGVNPRGSLVAQQDLPERAELTRLGSCYVQRSAAVSALQAIPTVTAPVTFWNGEPAGGKSYIIDSINCTCTTTVGAATMLSMVGMIPIATSATAPATADTVVANSTTGRAYAGKGVMSHTVTVVDNGWFSIGGTNNAAALTATVGLQIEVAVYGAIILAPGYLLALAPLAAAAGAFKFCIRYFEVAIPTVTV